MQTVQACMVCPSRGTSHSPRATGAEAACDPWRSAPTLSTSVVVATAASSPSSKMIRHAPWLTRTQVRLDRKISVQSTCDLCFLSLSFFFLSLLVQLLFLVSGLSLGGVDLQQGSHDTTYLLHRSTLDLMYQLHTWEFKCRWIECGWIDHFLKDGSSLVGRAEVETSLLSPPSSSTAVKLGPSLLTLKKGSGFQNEVHEETSLYLLLGAQDQRLGAEQDQLPCGSTGTSRGNCQETETGMVLACHTPHATASPTSSFSAPWRVGDAVVDRGNAGWITSKSGHPCPCQNCSKGPPAEKTGKYLCWIAPHVPPTTQSVKGLNGTELNIKVWVISHP